MRALDAAGGSTSTGAPAGGLNARGFWILVLLIDAFVLIFLPHIEWLVLAVSMAALAGLAVARVVRLVAFFLVGTSLLMLVPAEGDVSTLIFYALRLLLVLGLWVSAQRAGTGFARTLWPILRDRRTLFLLGLVAVVWIGLRWTPAPEYGLSKAVGFTLTAPLFFVATAFLWPTWERGREADRLITAALILGLGVAACGYAAAAGVRLPGAAEEAAFAESGRARLAWLGANAIWLARALGVWVVLGLWAAARGRIPTLAATVIGVLGFVLMALTGSRGPMLALVLAPAGLLLLPRPRSAVTPAPTAGAHRNGKRVAHAVLGIVAGLALLLALLPAEERARIGGAVLRTPAGAILASTTSGGGEGLGEFLGKDVSTSIRQHLIERAVEITRTALPRGLGTGGFAFVLTGQDLRLYPHNIEAEVLIEQGIVGIFLLIGFFFLVWRAAWRLSARGQSDGRWVWLLFCMAWLNAQVSGDLPFNNGIWIWGGILTALHLREKRTRELRSLDAL